MKNSLNPKDPITNEVNLCKKDRISVSELKNSLSQSATQNNNCKYEFTNYPDAIPQECFVYFGLRAQAKQLTNQEMMMHMHFLNKHARIIEQREEKDVFMANGFTQMNQRGNEEEEKLKSEIMSNYNEFNDINAEAQSISIQTGTE